MTGTVGGCSMREIARRMDLSRNTVLQSASTADTDELLGKATSRPGILDPFNPYLNQRRNDGCTSAAACTKRSGLAASKAMRRPSDATLRQFRTTALHFFVLGIRSDQDVDTAGLVLPFSSGALEGRNCKVKHLKRLMYGQANSDLLRKTALLN